ncbi:Uncharacterised protein [Serratia fonticola]|uniref:hypothetical protein n=1 Tax=Serratia fonticola TaxID=47917 RepID=UPI002183FE6A|nr:hypothetical protein [Serratia fonticola]CAI2094159.1 Uncharacterised protein [Serratia fonticola]
MEEAVKNRGLYDLKIMLNKLSSNPSDFSLMLEIQFKIIYLILRRERDIKRLKRKSAMLKSSLRKNRLSKEESALVKSEIKNIASLINEKKFDVYIYRMFGDGVAFIYIDRFTIKQLFYNSLDYNVKEHAGDLGGKSGLRDEWALIKIAFRQGIPALLHDITMSVRHGDISLLGNDEPFLIEVKSSSNVNKRIERQKASLEKITNFITTDEAKGFRGIPLIKREAMNLPAEYHVKALNDCLRECKENGYSVVEPEKGFHIVAVREYDPQEIKDKFDFITSETQCVYLNDIKNASQWMPLSPFTLLIEDESDLCDFISGDLSIFCFISLDEMKKTSESEGVELVIDLDGDYSLLFKKFNDDMIWGVSRQMLLRVSLEMLSMSWLIRANIQKFNNFNLPGGSGDFKLSEGDAFKKPLEKYRPLFKK